MKFNTVRWMTIMAAGSILIGGNLVQAADPAPTVPKPEVKPPAAAPDAVKPAAPRDLVSIYGERLKLTDAQKEKFKPLIEDELKQMRELRLDKALTPENRMAKIQEIRKATNDKVKPILNPDQIESWNKMRMPRPATPLPSPGAAPAK